MNDDRAFWHGALAGLAAAAVLVGGWLAVQLADMRHMFDDMGKVEIPAITRVVLSPLWRWGFPALGAGLIALVAYQRPRATAAYALVAVAMIVGMIATWHFAQAPIFELADPIKE